MAKALVWTNPDGSTSNTIPTNSFKKLHKDKTEDQILDLVEAQSVPPGSINIKRIPENAFPADRIFRDSWEIVGNTIQENMSKARIIHQERMNRIKDREMQSLANQIIVQEALGNDATVIKSEIQGIQTAIDNVGPNINAAGTPAMLKAVWPAGLPRE